MSMMNFFLPPLIATGLCFILRSTLFYADVCNIFLTGDISDDNFMAPLV